MAKVLGTIDRQEFPVVDADAFREALFMHPMEIVLEPTRTFADTYRDYACRWGQLNEGERSWEREALIQTIKEADQVALSLNLAMPSKSQPLKTANNGTRVLKFIRPTGRQDLAPRKP